MTAPDDPADHDPTRLPIDVIPPLPTGYEIRPARPTDLASLAAIESAAGQIFHGIDMHDVADDEGPTPETFEAALAAGRLWVAVHEGHPVGYVLARHLDDQAHLEQLSVDPDHGRRGLGTALVGVVVEWGSTLGGHDVTLSTFRDVAWNRPYYERLGFEVVDDASLSPALQAVRAHEAAEGLDIDARVIMRRTVGAVDRRRATDRVASIERER